MNANRFTIATLALLLCAAPALLAQSGAVTRQIPSSGITTIQPAGIGSGALQSPEFDPALVDNDSADLSGSRGSGGKIINRSIAKSTGHGPIIHGNGKAKSNPELVNSFDGLTFRQQRTANNGNQFSVEPPDQGLCAGNGFVLESVNDVLRVWDTAGNAQVGVTDLNTFYGYAPAIIRGRPNKFGPSITDPSCYYDHDTQRWFQVVLTLDRVGTSSRLTGSNHLDIAVSTTSNPLGTWNIYRIPVQNDGSDGTPNHNCNGGPCLGDYPHIGADANGIFLTTNEFSLFAPGFTGSQIYALSKQALVAGAPTITVVQFDTSTLNTLNAAFDGAPGFTVWPATSPASAQAGAQGGTEYFLSSQAVFEDSGSDSRLRIWALTNTRSLNSNYPSLNLTSGVVNVDQYAVPDRSSQKAGDFPLGQAINAGFFGASPFGSEVESPLDSNDSRMQQVVFANGKLWGALDTAVNVDGQNQAGIAYFIIRPHVDAHGVSGSAINQGTIAVSNNNVNYPAVGVNQSGRGIIAFTLVGADNFPSAAYASLDDKIGAGDVHVAAAGLGPQDGFTGYKFEVGNPPRPRWGDYGATAADGNSIWFSSEYSGQTCNLSTFAADTTCGGTRTILGNWYTRISQVTF